MDDIKQKLQNLQEKLKIDEKRKKLQELQAYSMSPSFWQDHIKAAETMKQVSALQKEIEEIERIQEFLEKGQQAEAEKLIADLEKFVFLSGEYDEENALLSIHAGQGGVEAMDWSEMLFRMYTRFCEKKQWSLEVLDETRGEEAGIKSITCAIEGKYAYGLLKHEAGVHRLVRQSPFNADKLRQTSFALVEVLPQIENTAEVEIKDDDLEWDFYRASSHGGQNVQKVSSAVRLNHKPTGIIVTAQAERYQGQNREYALKILRAKLWNIQEEERRKKEQQLKGGYKTPGWGNQIRSYVLHPYHMVKDLRTQHETSQADSVLDGDLDKFIEAELQI